MHRSDSDPDCAAALSFDTARPAHCLAASPRSSAAHSSTRRVLSTAVPVHRGDGHSSFQWPGSRDTSASGAPGACRAWCRSRAWLPVLRARRCASFASSDRTPKCAARRCSDARDPAAPRSYPRTPAVVLPPATAPLPCPASARPASAPASPALEFCLQGPAALGRATKTPLACASCSLQRPADLWE